jgi:hypothetical protein
VLQAALALSEEERAQLVEELEASLPVEDDDEFVAMINARVAAAEAGAPGTPRTKCSTSFSRDEERVQRRRQGRAPSRSRDLRSGARGPWARVLA